MAAISTRARLDLAPQRLAPGRGWLFAGSVLLVLCIALAFGGATHGDALSSAVIQIASLPLLGVAIWRLTTVRLDGRAKAAIWLLAAIIVLPLLQLIPLPPEVWSRLPGRGFVLSDYLALGIAPPWLPTSLTPYETAGALPWLAPPAAMFLATLSLTAAERRAMVLAIPILALIAVVLGMLQVAAGSDTPLRFYAVTNPDSAVGFFANRNHQAALLVIAAAVTPLWITTFRQGEQQVGLFGLFLAFGIELVLIVGIGVTGSRAGVFLAIPAMFGGVLIVLARGKANSMRRSAIALLGAAIGAGLVGLYGSSELIARFRAPLGADVRVKALPAIEHAAEAFFPFGSGLGSFDRIYQLFEPIGGVNQFYLNHAHNDALELWLEAGALGVVLMAAFLAWWVWSTARLWRRGHREENGVRAAASLVIALALAHSLVDYPLRTEALAALFALACAVLVAPNDVEAGPGAGRVKRRRVRIEGGKGQRLSRGDDARLNRRHRPANEEER